MKPKPTEVNLWALCDPDGFVLCGTLSSSGEAGAWCNAVVCELNDKKDTAIKDLIDKGYTCIHVTIMPREAE